MGCCELSARGRTDRPQLRRLAPISTAGVLECLGLSGSGSGSGADGDEWVGDFWPNDAVAVLWHILCVCVFGYLLKTDAPPNHPHPPSWNSIAPLSCHILVCAIIDQSKVTQNMLSSMMLRNVKAPQPFVFTPFAFRTLCLTCPSCSIPSWFSSLSLVCRRCARSRRRRSLLPPLPPPLPPPPPPPPRYAQSYQSVFLYEQKMREARGLA